MLKALFCFQNLYVFVVYLSRNLEEAIEHLTMEILLNPNSTIFCSWCYAGGFANGVVGRCNQRASSSEVAGSLR
jgi:hypothetical protein